MTAEPRGNAAALLLEIGCEEIPARMIPRAASDLATALVAILDGAGLAHGSATAWGGSRRLAVRVEAVAERQADREETVLGPARAAAFDASGAPTRAALGFAGKHGIDPAGLSEIRTDRGAYVGFARRVSGSSLGQILAGALPGAVRGMSFPKTMRWGTGVERWVRPVHRLVALHGSEVLALTLFGVESGRATAGHRFLAAGPVVLAHADDYVDALARARVVADPARRRAILAHALDEAARSLDGRVVADARLLDEVADLVEWPGVVVGTFDPAHLGLPREILATTLRHHQKCFCVETPSASLCAGFLAVANTDRDPAGHVRRGNEWVVAGRLDDARFFWTEDRKRPLAARASALESVVFHARAGSYAAKARRLEQLARTLARELDLSDERVERSAQAAALCKCDLVTGIVGEFPELQGIAGGLLLREEGRPEEIWRAVYEHYRPLGPDDTIPETPGGRIVSVVDKLDTLAQLFAAGERASGSRDPLGLRRAGNGILRVLLECGWPIPLAWLVDHAGGSPEVREFLEERMAALFREDGYSTNEILAMLRPRLGDAEPLAWPLADMRARLEAIARVRDREDFRKLVKLTERVDNILSKNADEMQRVVDGSAAPRHVESAAAALALAERIARAEARLGVLAAERGYAAIVEALAEFIDPVERFFVDCLVLDAADPSASASRFGLLVRLRSLLTRYFDVRELAGEAGRRGS